MFHFLKPALLRLPIGARLATKNYTHPARTASVGRKPEIAIRHGCSQLALQFRRLASSAAAGYLHPV